MNISNNATSPSFTARMKDNYPLKQNVNMMDEEQNKQFKSALTDLAKTNPNDVLSLHVEKEVNGYQNVHYIIENDSKPGKSYKEFIQHVSMWNPDKLTQMIKNIANPESDAHKALFAEDSNPKKDVMNRLA